MSMRPAAPAVCLLLSFAGVGAAGLIDIGSEKQLLWDEYLIESLKDTRFVLNPATKAPNNPVIPRGHRSMKFQVNPAPRALAPFEKETSFVPSRTSLAILTEP